MVNKETLKRIYKRITLNFKPILKLASICVAGLYSFAGFISPWASFEGVFSSEWSFVEKVLFSLCILLTIFVACFIYAAIRILNKQVNHIFTSNANGSVFVEYGDMYSPDIISKNYSGRRNIVVSVNRCFDTIVDNNLVSERTQHGRVMNRLYNVGLYDEGSLNEKMQNYLHSMNYPYDDLTTVNKPEGNTYRYIAGAVADVEAENNLHFYMLGLSKFDSQLKASTSTEEFTQAVQGLIEFCYTKSQGYPVILPLIGSEMARTGIDRTDILKYIVQAFRINSDKIICDFHIVVWKGDKDKVSINNL